MTPSKPSEMPEVWISTKETVSTQVQPDHKWPCVFPFKRDHSVRYVRYDLAEKNRAEVVVITMKDAKNIYEQLHRMNFENERTDPEYLGSYVNLKAKEALALLEKNRVGG